MEQLSFFNTDIPYSPLPANIYGKGIRIKPNKITRNEHLPELLPLEDYDYILVGYSGGKDCTAAILYLLELGVPKNKIKLLHHCIDGKDDDNNLLSMDWPCTKSYCQQFADVMGLDIKYSWREEGFAGELLRLGASKPIAFEEFNTDNLKVTTTETWEKTKALKKALEEAKRNNDYEKQEEINTELKLLGYRFKFPAKSPSLSVRWCSSMLKIEVCNRLLRYADATMKDCKVLFIDGIRREESAGRSRYNEMELHASTAITKNRIIHHWRAVIEWNEQMIWDIMKRWNITPHPCYKLGWNRCSCAMCIFSMPYHFKGIQEVLPDRFNQLLKLESSLNFTVDNKKDLISYINGAKSCVLNHDKELIKLAQSKDLPSDYIINNKKWILPAGAFHGAEGGPC
jgi:3'-phosphoadenosine 5'-phosphosulfate sulfotransferase (PAPS reductase)/FAD synthetase